MNDGGATTRFALPASSATSGAVAYRIRAITRPKDDAAIAAVPRCCWVICDVSDGNQRISLAAGARLRSRRSRIRRRTFNCPASSEATPIIAIAERFSPENFLRDICA
ncbi:hypothetical protein bAD24_p01110 (plasmid) [Burkholderia sp. AD24]|nr:hypothetical protein bAD24_p01110 [Burkholderia sp. AD24]